MKSQAVVKKTEGCCEPTCCNAVQKKSVSIKLDCCSLGGCCAK
jgi:hypothetical protein